MSFLVLRSGLSQALSFVGPQVSELHGAPGVAAASWWCEVWASFCSLFGALHYIAGWVPCPSGLCMALLLAGNLLFVVLFYVALAGELLRGQ